MASVKTQEVTKVTEKITCGHHGVRLTGKVRDGSPYVKIYKGIAAFSQSLEIRTLDDIRRLRDALDTIIDEAEKFSD